MPRHACSRGGLMTWPLSVLLVLAACAAPPDGPARTDHAGTGPAKIDHAGTGPAEIDHAEIDRMFDMLVDEATPQTAPGIAPKTAPGIAPGMFLNLQGEAIQTREMRRLIEQLSRPEPLIP
jgi:hypothetical protein